MSYHPTLSLNLYSQYFLKKFIDKIDPSALAGDPELISAYQEVRGIIQGIFQDEIDSIDEAIHRAESLSNLQLLKEWENLHIYLGHIPSHNTEASCLILDREIHRRGLVRQKQLILDTYDGADKSQFLEETPENLEQKSDDKLVADWFVYHDTLHVLYHLEGQDRRKLQHLERELERRGILCEGTLLRKKGIFLQ
jgi:hypothetical protein